MMKFIRHSGNTIHEFYFYSSKDYEANFLDQTQSNVDSQVNQSVRDIGSKTTVNHPLSARRLNWDTVIVVSDWRVGARTKKAR